MRVDPLVYNYPVRVRAISLLIVLFISGVFYISPRLKENTTTIEKFIPQDIESIVVPPTEQMQIEVLHAFQLSGISPQKLTRMTKT